MIEVAVGDSVETYKALSLNKGTSDNPQSCLAEIRVSHHRYSYHRLLNTASGKLMQNQWPDTDSMISLISRSQNDTIVYRLPIFVAWTSHTHNKRIDILGDLNASASTNPDSWVRKSHESQPRQ